MGFGACLRRAAIRHRDGLPERCRGHVREFGNRVSRPTDGDLTRDLARKFGLLYAGALLALEADVVAWSEIRIRNALTRAYRGARDLLPDDDARDLREGRRNLTTLLKSLPVLEKRHRKDPSRIEIELGNGYRSTSEDARFAMVRVETFHSAFTSVPQRTLVESWLVASGRVDVAHAKTNARIGPRIKDQHIWPDGRRVRSVLIRRPQPNAA